MIHLAPTDWRTVRTSTATGRCALDYSHADLLFTARPCRVHSIVAGGQVQTAPKPESPGRLHLLSMRCFVDMVNWCWTTLLDPALAACFCPRSAQPLLGRQLRQLKMVLLQTVSVPMGLGGLLFVAHSSLRCRRRRTGLSAERCRAAGCRAYR